MAFSTEEKSPPLSSFWKEWPPGSKALGCHKQDCQTESHLFIPQSPKCLCCFVLFFNHPLCATCQPLLLPQTPTTTPYREEAGLREGKGLVQGTQQVRAVWNPAPLAPGPGPWAPCLQWLPLPLLPAPPGRGTHQPCCRRPGTSRGLTT